MNICDLPNVMLIQIFDWLSYDEVSKKRLVCRRFDQIAQEVLNGGFNKVIKRHNISSRRIKALLPRRESERRTHCLSRYSDILGSIETRISMLSMTYTKYIDLNLCCFIPGRVLDEIFRILRLISKPGKQLRPHEVLQELRDISSMAIEHFDEKIVQNLKNTYVNANKMSGGSSYSADTRRLTATISFSGMGTSIPSTIKTDPVSLYSNGYDLDRLTPALRCLGDQLFASSLKTTLGDSEPQREQLQTVFPSTSKSFLEHQYPVGGCPEARTTTIYVKKMETEYKKGIIKIHRMQQFQNLQHKRLQQSAKSVAELNTQIVELKKRMEDLDAKNREICANMRHISGGEPTKTEKINNNTAAVTESNDDINNSKLCPSESRSSVSKQPNKESNKRRVDSEIVFPRETAEDDIEDNCDFKVKKPKLQS